MDSDTNYFGSSNRLPIFATLPIKCNERGYVGGHKLHTNPGSPYISLIRNLAIESPTRLSSDLFLRGDPSQRGDPNFTKLTFSPVKHQCAELNVHENAIKRKKSFFEISEKTCVYKTANTENVLLRMQ